MPTVSRLVVGLLDFTTRSFIFKIRERLEIDHCLRWISEEEERQ